MNPEKMSAGMRFSVIHRVFRKRMDALLSEYDLTGPQLCVLGQLARLSEDGGEVNQRGVESAVHLSHASVTAMLQRLESKGFIESARSGVDKRSKCLRLTEKAEALHESIFALDTQVFDSLCEGMTQAQRGQMCELLNRMLNNAMLYEKKGSMEAE